MSAHANALLSSVMPGDENKSGLIMFKESLLCNIMPVSSSNSRAAAERIYTDFAAFDGIIRCAELRLNNILNMNDTSEMRLFMNGICKAVVERLLQDGENEKAFMMESFFHKEMEEEFHYSAYAACFSKYRDDAKSV